MQGVNIIDEKVFLSRVCRGIKSGRRASELNSDMASCDGSMRWRIAHHKIEIETKGVAIEVDGRANVMYGQNWARSENLWF